MRRRLAPLVVVLALTGCGTQVLPPAGPDLPGPPLPSSWSLHHQVVESSRARVGGEGVSAFEESTSVEVSAADGRPADQCSVLVDRSGDDGPERRVGAKIPTEVRGTPALRNGAGAEGPYLMWRAPDRAWVTVQCDHEDTLALVADRVRPGRGSTLLPFGFTVPDGYAVSSFRVTRDPLDVAIGVERLDRAFDESLYVTLRAVEVSSAPTGTPTTVAGRRAFRSENPKFPSVCVAARETPAAYVCVGIPPDDMGPYPERIDDLPTITAIADSVRVADLDDPHTWFDAGEAFI